MFKRIFSWFRRKPIVFPTHYPSPFGVLRARQLKNDMWVLWSDKQGRAFDLQTRKIFWWEKGDKYWPSCAGTRIQVHNAAIKLNSLEFKD